MQIIIFLSTFCLQSAFSQLSSNEDNFLIYVQNILHRQFTPGCSLSVSLPNSQLFASSQDKFDVVNPLIELLNHDMYWTLNVFQYNSDIPETNLSNLLKTQGYLMFTLPCKDFEELKEDLSEQLAGLNALETWNSKSQFLIVVTNVVEHLPGDLAHDVLQELWNYNVFEAFVIIPTTVEFKTVIDRPELMLEFHLYTRIPYHSTKICLKFSEAILLEQWYSKLNNSSLSLKGPFKHKIPTNFNRCPLRVLSHSNEYKWEVNNEGEKKLKYYDPVMLLVSVALEKLNITLVQMPPKLINDTYKAMQDVLQNVFFGETDIGSGVLIDFWAAKFADYAKNGVFYQNAWYIPCKQYKSRVTTVSRIFDTSVWLSIGSSFILASIIMKVVTIFCRQKGVSESALFKSISSCLYSLWAVLLGVGLPELPYSTSLRTIFFIFVCYSFGLNTIFQTYFTSLLVDPGFEHQIESVEELLTSNLEFGYYPAFEYQFLVSSEKMHQDILKRRLHCRERKYCFDRVSKKGDFAYFSMIVIADIYKTLFNEEASMCSLDHESMFNIVSVYMKQENVLLGIIDRKLLELFEAGLTLKFKHNQLLAYKMGILKLKELHTNDSFASYNLKNKDYIPLGFIHLQVAFYMALLGNLSSIIFFMMELVYSRIENKFYNKVL